MQRRILTEECHCQNKKTHPYPYPYLLTEDINYQIHFSHVVLADFDVYDSQQMHSFIHSSLAVLQLISLDLQKN